MLSKLSAWRLTPVLLRGRKPAHRNASLIRLLPRLCHLAWGRQKRVISNNATQAYFAALQLSGRYHILDTNHSNYLLHREINGRRATRSSQFY